MLPTPSTTKTCVYAKGTQVQYGFMFTILHVYVGCSSDHQKISKSHTSSVLFSSTLKIKIDKSIDTIKM